MVEVGSAEFILSADSAKLLGDLAKAEKATRDSANRQAAAIAKANAVSVADVKRAVAARIAEEKKAEAAAVASAKKIEEAHSKSGAGFASAAKGALAFGAGLTAVATAADLAKEAIKFVGEETQKQAQAQFAVNKLYGDLAPIVTRNAEALAQYAGRSKTEALEAAAAVATLGRNYGLNIKQQDQVLKISANLAAVRGISMADASERVASALRGEAEAAEYLGQTLNSDAVKAMANMTAEQRKNFETLGPLEKAQIILGKLVGDNADLMGAAAERANSAAGATDRVKAASADLAVTLGNALTPAFVSTTSVVTAAITELDKFINKVNEVNANNAKFDEAQKKRIEDLRRQGRNREALEAALQAAQDRNNPNRAADAAQVAPRNSLPPGEDSSAAQAQAVTAAAERADAATKRIAAAEEVRRRQAAKELDDAEKATKKALEIELDAIDKEKKAKERWYDEERTRIEARRAHVLEDIETRKDAALAGIEAEKVAAKDAADANIAQLEREKKSRLDAAEEAKDQAEKAIEDEKRRLDHAREIEDRSTDDAREQEDRALADRRHTQDEEREKAQTKELRRLDDLKDARLKATDEEIADAQKASDKKIRAMDREADKAQANSQKAIRNIEAQADKARTASEQAIRGIEKQADAEDERHRNAVQALEDEQDARLEELDTQLKALDAQEKSLDAAERMADLQRKASDIERDLTKARGSGDPAAMAAAQQALQRAIRSNDQIAALAARKALDTAAGTGNPEEIKKLEQDLADTHADIEEEKLKVTEDAAKDALEAKKDAIKEEIAVRKRAEDDQNRARKAELDAEKQSQQDILKATLSRLDSEKQGEQDSLKGTLDKLAKKKQASQDATKDEIEELRKRREAEQKDAEESVRLTREKYVDQTNALKDARTEEDRQRDDRREKEDEDRKDFRAAEDDKLRIQRDAVQQALANERAATENHYNGPNGIITQAKAASEAQQREYSARLAAARAAYEEERKAAERVFQNPDKTGLLDLLAKAREDETAKLDQSKEDWRKWQEDVSAKIKKAQDDLDAFVKSGASAPGGAAGSNSPGGKNAYGNDPTGQFWTIPGTKTKVELGSNPGTVAPGAQIPNIDAAEVEAFIKQIAPQYRIPVADALAVYRGEGRSAYVGDYGTSFGPYQLHVGGGLGDDFQRTYKADLRDPSTWQQQVMYTMAYVQAHGWNNQWHGAPSDIANKKYDSGHLFAQPTMTYTPSTGERAWIAEKRPEMLVGGAATAAAQRFNEMARFGGMARTPSVGGGYAPNYARIGDTMSALRSDTAAPARAGDTYHLNGVHPESVYQETERRKRRSQWLYGRTF